MSRIPPIFPLLLLRRLNAAFLLPSLLVPLWVENDWRARLIAHPPAAKSLARLADPDLKVTVTCRLPAADEAAETLPDAVRAANPLALHPCSPASATERAAASPGWRVPSASTRPAAGSSASAPPTPRTGAAEP